jgi:hypothetical protein
VSSLNPDLIDDIAMRRAALFIGAGVSSGAVTKAGKRIRQWADFLSDVAKNIGEPDVREHAERMIKEKDYLMACELIREAVGSQSWEVSLMDEFAQIGSVTSLHKALISLRQRIIVTTNFDKFLEAAWSDINKDATHYPKTEISITDESFKAFRDNREYIFKIHGSIDDPSSIIFSRSDYNQKAYGNWAYTKFVETMLLTHTIIFIGFSLNDPAISYILEMYAQHLPKARPHYIFLSEPVSQQYIEISKRLRRIFIIPYNNKNNHEELTSLIEDLGAQASERRREIIATEWSAIKHV